MSKVKLYFIILSGLVLSACAVSPQSITLNPSVTVVQNNIGQGRFINIKVIDKRPDKVLGTRGGVYSSTALLTIDGGPEEPVRQELVGAFSGYGFNVINATDGARIDIDLTIEIETLDYTVKGDQYPKLVKNNILLRTICKKQDLEFSSRYTANKEEEVLTTPTANKNERMVNALVSKALYSLVTDQRLINFLQ